MIYFLYKANNITNIGGVVPPQPKTGHLGLCYYDGWFLGCIEASELSYIQKNKEYNFQICNEEIANGFKLLGVTSIQENPEDEPRDLTVDELFLQKKANDFLTKLNVRLQISATVGDPDDQIADITKGLALLERCVYAMYKAGKANGVVLEEPWETLLNMAVTDFENKTLVDPIDFRPDGYSGVYEIIKSRRVSLVSSLVPYYNEVMGEKSEAVGETVE